MKRRTFLQSVSGLILWQPCWPAVSTPLQSTITDFEDGGFLIEIGPLHCCLYPEAYGSVLDFVVYITDYPMPGMIRERRMVPSELLSQKLEEVGFPSRLEGDEQWPSLIVHMPRIVTPNEVAERLQQLLRAGDWTLLYYAPDSGG